MTAPPTPPDRLARLLQAHRMLTRATVEAEALAAPGRRPGPAVMVLAGLLGDAAADVRLLLPETVLPVLDHRPDPAGEDPLDLVRRARRLTGQHLPPGGAPALALLADVVGDLR